MDDPTEASKGTAVPVAVENKIEADVKETANANGVIETNMETADGEKEW